MIDTRIQLGEERAEYAGFIRYEGRYCFYFNDQNILKIEYLDSGEIDCFDVHSFCEHDLKKVASELRALQVS